MKKSTDTGTLAWGTTAARATQMARSKSHRTIAGFPSSENEECVYITVLTIQFHRVLQIRIYYYAAQDLKTRLKNSQNHWEKIDISFQSTLYGILQTDVRTVKFQIYSVKI